jgi:hypothetical protein
LRKGYGPLDVPLVHDQGRDLPVSEIPLGTPLLRSEPRLSEALRFFENPSIREACVDRVAQAGGEGFFARKGWEAELRRLTHRGSGGHLESPQDREAAIRRELVDSRRAIEERLGKPSVHLCYPWHVSGPTARRLAHDAGYRSVFCGKVRGMPISLPGSDPHAIARIGEDYVELLPGKDRATLTGILRQKLARRLSNLH